jgi:hypothetical protein
MKKHGQVWPDILIKIGKFAVIVDWPDAMKMITIQYKTLPTRETYFTTLLFVKKIFGPVYWLSEYRAEVIKDGKRTK